MRLRPFPQSDGIRGRSSVSILLTAALAIYANPHAGIRITGIRLFALDKAPGRNVIVWAKVNAIKRNNYNILLDLGGGVHAGSKSRVLDG
jgi:hypothetical protein